MNQASLLEADGRIWRASGEAMKGRKYGSCWGEREREKERERERGTDGQTDRGGNELWRDREEQDSDLSNPILQLIRTDGVSIMRLRTRDTSFKWRRSEEGGK